MQYGMGSNQKIGNPYNFLDRNRPRKMVFYGRVSTEHEAQLSALENQIQWYDEQAKYHPNWTVLDKYIDEGITGTQAKKRPSFLRMLEDAKKGKFDLIVTREVCRFARNTVDTLVTTRELKNMGIEVYFVEDNIWTMDNDGELRLTIMATLAQEESRKVSERVKAGQMISREKHSVYGSGNILGYNRVGRSYVINEEQADTVRLIYELYSQGELGFARIADILTSQGRLNASGKDRWAPGTIGRILANATYMGYMAYGKSYTNNYLEQKRINNHDASTYMMVKADFEPIVSEELWNKCQDIRNKRTFELLEITHDDNSILKRPRKKGKVQNHDLWGSKLRCACGATFRKNRWHRNKDNKWSYGYQCYNQLNNGSALSRIKNGADPTGYCGQEMITDWKLDMMGKEIIKQIFGDKKETIELACQTIKDSYQIDKKGGSTTLPIIISNIDKLKKKKEILLEMRTDGEIDKEEYIAQKQKIDTEIQVLQTQYNEESSKVEAAEKPDICWDKIMETINSITDEAGDQHELIRKLVDRIVPDGKWRFKWYLNLEGNDNVELDLRVDGKKNHAVVAIEEGTDKVPSVTYESALTNRDFYEIITLSSIREYKKTSPFTTRYRQLSVIGRTKGTSPFPTQYRPLSKSRGNNPVSGEIPFKIADLTVDEAYAHRFLEKVRDVHHFKTGKWKDVKITICI